jgi:repressor LexA
MSPSYLTERQRAILEFIEDFQARRGISPTHREICEQFGFSSYGTAYKHLKLLADKGFLRRDWNQKRGLELLHSARAERTPAHQLPFYGRIAAGRPLEALAGGDEITVPAHLMTGDSDQHYVLQVVGESMIGEGIFDGDFVVVRRRQRADAGEMVVVLVGEEATLKRFYPEGERVRLQPSNPTMEPIYVPAAGVAVQGVVVGLMRRF